MVKHLLGKKIGAVFCSVALAASMCPVVAFAGQVGAEDAQASAKTTQEAAATALSVSLADAFEVDGQYVITAQEDSTTYAMDSDLTADEITVDNGTISAVDGAKDLTELTWVYEAGDTYGYLKNASTGEYLYYSSYDEKMSTSADEKDTISYEDNRLSISYLMWDYTYSDKIVLSYGSEFVAESYSTGMTITLYKVSEGGSQSCEHAWVDTVVAPTCTEKGYTLHTCSKCNREKKDAYVDALDHDYEGVEWTVVSEPTCTVDGQQQRGCTRCDYLDKQAIAKLGHDFTKLTDLGDKHRVSCARCDADPDGCTVAVTDKVEEGKSYVLVYGGRALANTVVASDDSYSGTSNKMASIAFDASAMIPASAVWTWTNGHLMSDGKYLANPSGTNMAMVDNEADALTFEYQDDFYGDGKILKATNVQSYYDTLGLSSSVDGSMGLVSAYSNDALVTLYEATVVPAEADHAYVDGVCACGHKEFVYMKGDVNNNGKMNIVDAQVAYDLAANKYVDQALSNLLSLWGNGVTIDMVKTVANYNGDDALDATDAFAIQVAVHTASAA